MQFIKLTYLDGYTFMVNMDKVIAMESLKDTTGAMYTQLSIDLNGGMPLNVKESISQILEMLPYHKYS